MKAPGRAGPGGTLAAAVVALEILSAAGAARASSGRSGDRCPAVRVVVRGDSVWGIARECGLSVRAILRANDLEDGSHIRPGQRLRIPGGHRERSGDSASSAPEASGDGATTPEEPVAGDVAASDGSGEARSTSIAFYSNHSGEDATIRLFNSGGRFRESARSSIDRILRHVETGRRIHVDVDLLRLVQRVADHWPGRRLLVQSAVRPARRRSGKPLGNHMTGKAIDFAVEGVSNEELRDFCRTLPNAGVGYYPNSTFVHLDTRDRPAYWIDVSGPGESPRYVDPDTWTREEDGSGSPPDGPVEADSPAPSPDAAADGTEP